ALGRPRADRTFPVPPGFRLREQVVYEGACPGPMPAESWAAEGPGGVLVNLSAFSIPAPTPTPQGAGTGEPAPDGPEPADAWLPGAPGPVRPPNVQAVLGVWAVDSGLIVATEPDEGSLWDRYLEAIVAGDRGLGLRALVGHMAEAAGALDALHAA